MSEEHQDQNPSETSAADQDEKKSIKEKLGDRLHKEPSEAQVLAAEHHALALTTLVELLKSEDEGIRLQAAHIILDRPKPSAPTPPGKAALLKVKKVIL